MGRTAKSSKRRGSKASPPLRMRPVVPQGATGPNSDVCVVCGAVQPDKYDSTLMCALGHATCFACVAVGVQPHELCGHACNGFKYQCFGCEIWLCINKTQGLALMCGGHALARRRLDEEEIHPNTFDAPGSYCSHEGEDTHSSSSSSAGDEEDRCCPCATVAEGDEAVVVVQLPRVCSVDWSKDRTQRARRLARLRASLLGV